MQIEARLEFIIREAMIDEIVLRNRYDRHGVSEHRRRPCASGGAPKGVHDEDSCNVNGLAGNAFP